MLLGRCCRPAECRSSHVTAPKTARLAPELIPSARGCKTETTDGGAPTTAGRYGAINGGEFGLRCSERSLLALTHRDRAALDTSADTLRGLA